MAATTNAWDDDDDTQLRQLHGEGLGCRAIAARMGRGRSAVSRHAADLGLSFDRDQTANATAASTAELKKRRALEAAQLLDDAIALRELMFAPYTHVANSKDGPETIRLDAPPAAEVRNYATAYGICVTKHLELLRHDADAGIDEAKGVLGRLAEHFGITFGQAPDAST